MQLPRVAIIAIFSSLWIKEPLSNLIGYSWTRSIRKETRAARQKLLDSRKIFPSFKTLHRRELLSTRRHWILAWRPFIKTLSCRSPPSTQTELQKKFAPLELMAGSKFGTWLLRLKVSNSNNFINSAAQENLRWNGIKFLLRSFLLCRFSLNLFPICPVNSSRRSQKFFNDHGCERQKVSNKVGRFPSSPRSWCLKQLKISKYFVKGWISYHKRRTHVS